MKKSIWRLIGAAILLAGVSNALRHLPNDSMRHDLTYVIAYLAFNILLAAIGVWLAKKHSVRDLRDSTRLSSQATTRFARNLYRFPDS
jgi:hypothetical protein